MCRYACDLEPMLKVLAGPSNIHKLLDIDASVRFINKHLQIIVSILFFAITQF